MDGVLGIGTVKARWIGHQIRAGIDVHASANTTLPEAHELAERLRHRLMHDVAHLRDAAIRVVPRMSKGGPASSPV